VFCLILMEFGVESSFILMWVIMKGLFSVLVVVVDDRGREYDILTRTLLHV